MEYIKLSPHYNYIGAFITFSCFMKCPWCLNRFNRLPYTAPLSGKDWIRALNKIPATTDLPITLQGGEPSAHEDFYEIINGVDKPMDILTNLQFDVENFMRKVGPDKFKREAPYASIRVSFHPNRTLFPAMVRDVRKLMEKGYQVGVWGIRHPLYEYMMENVEVTCRMYGIDFRFKDFLGEYKGKMYGTYRYPDALAKGAIGQCLCKTSELLIAPNGEVYRCHGDLYTKNDSIGNILNDDFAPLDKFVPCDHYGMCNPCDVKVKNDRFQQYGHCSMQIKGVMRYDEREEQFTTT